MLSPGLQGHLAQYWPNGIGYAMLTLLLFSHTCADMLSTYLWMCSKGAILSAKIRICMSSAPSSGSFIVTSLVGLEEDNRRAWVAK